MRSTNLIMFQSPIHRGTSINLRDERAARSTIISRMFQSLFIGALRSTLHRLHHRPMRRPRFNPLFVGALRSTGGGPLVAAELKASFNPLFIGALRSTGPIASHTNRANDQEFQSPYSSGHFDQLKELLLLMLRIDMVSIPYSSGHFDQRDPADWPSARRAGAVRFNPLFIEALRSTTRKAPKPRWPASCSFQSLFIGALRSAGPKREAALTGMVAHKFQSPIHRGTSININDSRPSAREGSSFNPLFIGALRSTNVLLGRYYIWSFLEDCFQSPYSSGHFDQPGDAVASVNVILTLNNPLFIGALRST